jgi:hypothetical protein
MPRFGYESAFRARADGQRKYLPVRFYSNVSLSEAG